MATPHEDAVLGYRTDRTVFTHSILFGVAESALASAHEMRQDAQALQAGPPADSNLITCWVMAAFAMEAYLNFAGEQLLPYWDDIERIGVRQKFSVLVKHVHFTPDLGRRPYQTLHRMWKNRDFFAHARTVTPRSIVNDGPLPVEVPYPTADWEEDLSLEATERLLEDVRTVHVDLHERFGLQDGSFGRTETRSGEVLRSAHPDGS